MSWIQLILLSIVQGIAEFLPISSSGHLAFIDLLFENQNPLSFYVFLHLATLLAVILFFIKDLWKLFLSLFSLPKAFQKKSFSQEHLMLFYIIIITIPTGIIGLLISHFYEDTTNFLFLGITFCTTAYLLYNSKKLPHRNEKLDTKKSLLIGTMQGISALPGISRSGSTITTALFLGISKETAAKISFIASIPAILGSEILDIAKNGNIPFTMQNIVAFILTFIVGILSLKFLMLIIKTDKLYYFSVYCLFIGILCFILNFAL